MSDGHTKDDASGDEITEASTGDQAEGQSRFQLWRPWAEVRSYAPLLAFLSWVGMVVLFALVRVDPWNESRSWRKWFRADERGWELLIPGILAALSTLLFVKGHDRWKTEGWSPEVVAMVFLAAGAATGGILWGLFCLGLRPFAG